MNIELGEFIVMPNHIHGIVMIGMNEFNKPDKNHLSSTQNGFLPQSKNLASVIRGYKIAVTTYARKNNIAFDWQTRFHEYIIRSEEDYLKISNYIIDNPTRWQEDILFGV